MCPPGVDQTERTGQKWQLLLPRQQRRIPYFRTSHRSGEYPPKDIVRVNKDLGWNLWDILYAPRQSDEQLSKIIDAPELPLQHGGVTLRLETLPAELLFQIMSWLSIDDLTQTAQTDDLTGAERMQRENQARKDILALGLASPRLWRSSLWHIAKIARQDAHRGSELIFTGTWLRTLPKSLVEAGLAPSSTLEDNRNGLPPPGKPYRGPRMSCGRRWNWSTWRWKQLDREVTASTPWSQAFDEVVFEADQQDSLPDWSMPTCDLRRTLQEVVDTPDRVSQPHPLKPSTVSLSAEETSTDVSNEAFLLRNLSKKLILQIKAPAKDCARGALLRPADKKVYKKLTNEFSLEHALSLRICWYTAKVRPCDAAKFLNRGSWAGDRFDIVLASSTLAHGWKDVTEDLASVLETWYKFHDDPTTPESDRSI